MRILIITWILMTTRIFSADFHDFDSYQYQLTSDEVEYKIKTYLEKNPAIHQFYKLTPQALYIGDLVHQQVDYVLHLNTSSSIQPNKSKKYQGLAKVKVAIDPGHFGGEFAELEERFIAIPAEKTKDHQPIRFQEGDLTYLTALELKKLLEAEGALVFISRPGIGRGAIEENFFQWFDKHPDLKKSFSPLPRIFRNFYNKEDLIARAKKINAFCPDFTIIIHYNAHFSDKEKGEKTLLTQSNFNLAFIPGAFGAKELEEIGDRYEFLRLIVTDDIEQSLKLSEYIVQQFVNKLNVPLISKEEKTSYTEAVCLIQKPGIYSRNLALTRLIHSPVCYGETLVQNNEYEIYRLSSPDITIAGTPCSKRIEKVAQAYFEGIKEYCSQQK